MVRILLCASVLAVAGCVATHNPTEVTHNVQAVESQRYIVAAASVDAARDLVVAAGGYVVAEFDLIEAVSADLSPAQQTELSGHPEVGYVFAEQQVV
ncbi:MAG: hypothetical protein AAFN07_15790, partial [Pseudomonadota bacterium]